MQTCVGCGKDAPETNTNYTLISAQFGWRLTRTKQPDGTITLAWRCPNCWRDHKRAKATPGSGALAPRAHQPEMRPPAGSDTEPAPSAPGGSVSGLSGRPRTSRAPATNSGIERPRRSRRP